MSMLPSQVTNMAAMSAKDLQAMVSVGQAILKGKTKSTKRKAPAKPRAKSAAKPKPKAKPVIKPKAKPKPKARAPKKLKAFPSDADA